MNAIIPLLPLPGDPAQILAALERPGGLGHAGPPAPYLARAIAALDIGGIIALAEGAPGHQVQLYRAWLAQRGTDAAAAPIWYNLGSALQQDGKPGEAAAAMQAALQLRPALWQAAYGFALATEAAAPTAAADAWRNALPDADARRQIHVQRARFLEARGELGPAIEEARAALLIDPDQPDVLQHLVHNRQRTATWPPTDLRVPGIDPEAAAFGAGPLAALALVDDPRRQADIAAGWIARKVPAAGPPLAPAGGYRHDRIRVGYLSSDFCRHAMSYLIAGLLELHDRQRFEVWGFDMSADDGSDLRQRIIAALDHHVNITAMDDDAAAAAIRGAEIDILVDLNGLTRGARPGILRRRPAPVQATYLGYVGPVPLPELDWLICDSLTIPPEREADYLPRPFRIAGCYQANDGQALSLPRVTRQVEGLPEDAFVFVCMSHHYKLTATVWDSWCRILAAVPRSVLWLVDDNPESRAALSARWAAAGLSAQRLIWAARTDPARYRARLGLGDLFLDTTPYNAGTIASDALRQGLPVLTTLGQAFAGRMGASLLSAVGLPDCIASDLDDYEARAIAIATDPERHRRLKDHLGTGAWERTLGDTAGFVRRFEDGLQQMCRMPGPL